VLASVLARLHRATCRRVREHLADPALPQSQLDVLLLLRHQPGLRVQDLATSLGVASNTASTLVQHLLKAGYLERRPDPGDRRVARLALSDAARGRMRRWHDRRAALLDEALTALAPDDRAGIERALPALRRLLALLEEHA
jgi:DNA-binding MarR family transcriptional regulator